MTKNSDSRPIKIIIVEPRGQGGMIHYAYTLCNALANQGAAVTLVTTTDYELEGLPHHFHTEKLLHLWKTTSKTIPPKNKILQIGHKAFRAIRRGFRGVRYVIQWIKLTHYLQNSDADIIQFGKIEFSFEAIFLNWLKKSGKTLTQICHEFELRERSNSPLANFLNSLYNNVYNNFSLLFFHAKENRDRFQSLFGQSDTPAVIIPHGNENLFLEAGINQSVRAKFIKEYGLSQNQPMALFFGLLAPSKGVADLINAFEIVHAEFPEAMLIISGAPSKYVNINDFHDQVKALGLKEIVMFDSRYIPIEEVGAWMSLATVVVYPYTSSTQSGSLQVAYTFGKPVIVTDVGGIPEAVENGKSGLIVSAGDQQSLAEAILKTLKDPDLAADMGKYAKELSETKFSWENIAREVISSYRSLITDLPR